MSQIDEAIILKSFQYEGYTHKKLPTKRAAYRRFYTILKLFNVLEYFFVHYYIRTKLLFCKFSFQGNLSYPYATAVLLPQKRPI